MHLISSQVTIPGLAGAGVNSRAADAMQASVLQVLEQSVLWRGRLPAAGCSYVQSLLFPLSFLLLLCKSCEWLNILPGQGKRRVFAQ